MTTTPKTPAGRRAAATPTSADGSTGNPVGTVSDAADGSSAGAGPAAPSPAAPSAFGATEAPSVSDVIAATLVEVYPFPEDQLWSEILPGLWQGGTADTDTVFASRGRHETPAITRTHFDTVVTAYAFARPADWLVTEHRFGFYDGDVEHIDMVRLREVVTAAHKAWKSGDKVLSRCQAGANRSGLITALILIRDGYSPAEAITLIRAKRGPQALFNLRFVTWLLNVNPTDWRN